jgi:DNA-binding CsgD family transcriptional regulator
MAGRPRVAWELLRPAALVLQRDDPRQSGLALADAALAAFLAGRAVDARATAERARKISPEREIYLAASVVEGFAALSLGDLEDSLNLMSAASRQPDLLEALAPVIEYLVPVAIGLTWSGCYDAATSVTDQAADFLRAIGALGLLPAALYASAYVNVWQGRLSRAYLRASEARALADEGGNTLWRFLATGCLALAEAMHGNPSECRRIATSAELHRAEVEDAMGLAALSTDDVAGALHHLERANTSEAFGPPIFGRPTTADLVEAYVRAGRVVPDSIARHVEAPVPESFPAVAAAVWRCRALLGAADTDQAFGAALGRYADAGLPWQQARTMLQYGQRLRRSGRRVDARHQLHRAVSLFEDLGSPAWASRAGTELAAAGGEGKRPMAQQPATLTPQEMHVALAVAAGATNREVSSSLFLSPKTIEMHLTRIYRKLGIHSRAALVLRFAENTGQELTDQSRHAP